MYIYIYIISKKKYFITIYMVIKSRSVEIIKFLILCLDCLNICFNLSKILMTSQYFRNSVIGKTQW